MLSELNLEPGPCSGNTPSSFQSRGKVSSSVTDVLKVCWTECQLGTWEDRRKTLGSYFLMHNEICGVKPHLSRFLKNNILVLQSYFQINGTGPMQKMLCIKGVDIQTYHVSSNKQEHYDIQFVVSVYAHTVEYSNKTNKIYSRRLQIYFLRDASQNINI